LHLAFATPSAVFPAPRQLAGADEIEQWAVRSAAAVDEALDALDRAAAEIGTALPGDTPNDGRFADPAVGLADDHRWLRANASRLRDAVAVLRTVEAPSPVQPIHGDLHVGQVLRWRDGYAIVDFDGNPTVPSSDSAPEPVARDVAQTLTSIDHVGRIADRRTAGARRAGLEAWIRDARAAFLAAYRATPAADLLDDRLLAAFEVEQECRELLYAARFLPRWRYAPMAMLRTLFPTPPDSSAPDRRQEPE
jgi:maltokinase